MDIMQQEEQNLITKQKAYDFLKKNIFATVSTLSADGKVQAATVIYLFDDNMDFYFATQKGTRKHNNLQEEGNVALVVGVGQAPITVQIEGKATSTVDKIPYVVDEIQKRMNMTGFFYGDMLKQHADNFVAYRVKIDWFRYTEIQKEGIITQEYFIPVS